MGEFEQRAEEWHAMARRSRLAENSVANYLRAIRKFAAWMDEHGPEYAEAFEDRDVRDFAARTYKKYLLVTEGRAPAGAAAHMAAVNAFFVWGGIGRPDVPGIEVPKRRKVGLDDDELVKVLRRARRHGPRDNAIMHVLFGSAVRVSECSALNVDDVAITQRTGVVLVRHGKGGKTREVTLNGMTRTAVQEWLDERPRYDGVDALFIGKRRERLQRSGLGRIASKIGAEVGVHVTPHVLRHSYGRRFMAEGGDIVTLAEQLGHARLETAMIYSRQTQAQVEASVERVAIEL